MRARHVVPLLASLALLCLATAGCLLDTARRDGSQCSRKNTCPRGQQCSSDGQCLYPCPASSCSDSDCGCSGIDRGSNESMNSMGWECRGDGLCHFTCQEYMGPPDAGPQGTCSSWMTCDTSRMLCLPACEDSSQCANGATCVPSGSNPENQPTNVPASFCRGSGSTGDGGVGDGGAADGPIMMQCGPTQVDVSQDAANCGSCGHDCKGGKCQGGRCQPYQIAPGSANASSMALDKTNVFWGDSLQAQLYRCLKTGCGTGPAALIQGVAGTPAQIATDATGGYVYWGGFDNKVWQCPKSGCPGDAKNLSDFSGNGIAVDDMSVYFFASGEVRRCAVPDCTGGSTTFAPPQPSRWAIAADGTDVAWYDAGGGSSNGVVWICPKSGCGGSPTQLATSEEGASAIVLYGDHVYWRSRNAIKRCAKMGCGGSPTPLIALDLETVPDCTDRLAVASHGVYWDQGGNIHRCKSLTCADGPEALTVGRQILPHVTADETYVFFMDSVGVYRLVP